MAIFLKQKDRVLVITIDRPEVMNAIDRETSDELGRAFYEFRDNDGLWVAILTGAGSKAFSTGADLKMMRKDISSESMLVFRDKYERGFNFGGITFGFNTWKPIIAAINGQCLAGGLELALACDIRIASENAVFGLPEVRWGIMPSAGGTQRLTRSIPLSKAMGMILTGETIGANEAHRLGLVSQVVPLHHLLPLAIEMSQKICKCGPLAVRAAKEAAYRGLQVPLEEGLQIERILAAAVLFTEDAKEGPLAFAQKRDPEYKGI